MKAFIGLLICSLRDLDSAAAAAAARIDSWRLEVLEVIDAGVLGAGVLGGEDAIEREVSSPGGDLGGQPSTAELCCKTIIIANSLEEEKQKKNFCKNSLQPNRRAKRSNS